MEESRARNAWTRNTNDTFCKLRELRHFSPKHFDRQRRKSGSRMDEKVPRNWTKRRRTRHMSCLATSSNSFDFVLYYKSSISIATVHTRVQSSFTERKSEITLGCYPCYKRYLGMVHGYVPTTLTHPSLSQQRRRRHNGISAASIVESTLLTSLAALAKLPSCITLKLLLDPERRSEA